MLRAILNKSWRQHPTRHQLYGHLPPITKTIQVRRARHAGHCWRSRDELISDVLLWTPTHGRAKQDDQHEHTFSSYVRIRDVVLKTYLGLWTIGRSGERGSGISVLPTRYDDDDYSVEEPVCRGWKWTFPTRIHMYHQGLQFAFLCFSQCFFERFQVYFFSRAFFKPLLLLSMLFIYLFHLFFLFPYFTTKFCFFFFWLLISTRVFSTYLLVVFSFVIFNFFFFWPCLDIF